MKLDPKIQGGEVGEPTFLLVIINGRTE